MAEQMTVEGSGLQLGDSYARALPQLHQPWAPTAGPAPSLVALNEELAITLGLDVAALRSPDGVAVLAGSAVPAGATTVAMAYAGHQFGGFSPRLGDGRALLLGEITAPGGQLHDVHLKGSGRTPFARGGDGRATLPAMLREHLMAEGMHALSIPTTRSLAVATTGEQIRREDGLIPGAVLTRTASSHLRVGTFQHAALLEQQHEQAGLVQRLADHAIERHHPELAASGDGRFLALLEAVTEAQASLVAQWMLVGFIHGVMNTDNVTISGETIDYGPCSFMDRFDPDTVYSSIDQHGRYAYGNQPTIAHWNLVRLAEALLPLLSDDREVAAADATAVLQRFPARYRHHWRVGMRAKLGLVTEEENDGRLGDALLDWMHAASADFTSTFRALASSLRGDDAPLDALATVEPARVWIASWRDRLTSEGRDPAVVADAMDAVNPLYIPRNHRVEEALDAAAAGDLAPFRTLLDVVTHPFVARPELDRFAEPASVAFAEGYRTFCGT
jgi:uncharacterized protein YdiU (UPF0061 family)